MSVTIIDLINCTASFTNCVGSMLDGGNKCLSTLIKWRQHFKCHVYFKLRVLACKALHVDDDVKSVNVHLRQIDFSVVKILIVEKSPILEYNIIDEFQTFESFVTKNKNNCVISLFQGGIFQILKHLDFLRKLFWWKIHQTQRQSKYSLNEESNSCNSKSRDVLDICANTTRWLVNWEYNYKTDRQFIYNIRSMS